MADRTSAGLFGKIFEYLAKNINKNSIEFANELFEMTYDYDFNTYQMYCDDALIKLGLAKEIDNDLVYKDDEA